MPIDLGTGAAIVFAASSFSANITGININGISRGSVDTTHLGTATARTFIPTDLIDAGELELEIQHDVNKYPPIKGAPETITVTHPLSTGGTTAGSYSFSGFATNYDANIPLEELQTGTLTIKITGDITTTAQT